MELYVAYKTNSFHSYDSRDLIGVADSHLNAFFICNKQADKEGHEFDDDQIYNLRNINQTQGYEGDGEFVIEKIESNELI